MIDVITAIGQQKIISVIRVPDAKTAVESALAIAEGGMTITEIPATVPQFEKVIEQLSRRPEMLVGAATLLNGADARAAIEAGASFLVSPVFVPDVLEIAQSSEVFYLPGAASPSEVFTLLQMGFEVVKIFPASHLGGPKYIRSLLAVMPDAKLVPTGSVSSSNIGEYFSAGAFAVGVGSSLVPKGLLDARDYETISRLASELLSAGKV